MTRVISSPETPRSSKRLIIANLSSAIPGEGVSTAFEEEEVAAGIGTGSGRILGWAIDGSPPIRVTIVPGGCG